ncbi:hypothetical protein EMCG_00493 [[Emmonsia] crescens]|uniref:Dynamin GTPase domain-containing protein n=1 Tax=[Emmonsia] crescens TaxID=73230 RepID=A0A0G2J8B3_9EURO|nr:hypothetical protein EMCG_00493 [Emmonsia crescens UAMH 3008]
MAIQLFSVFIKFPSNVLFSFGQSRKMDTPTGSELDGEQQATTSTELPSGTPSQDEAGSSDDVGFTNASLAALQSIEQRELLDLVDRLRRAGLSSILQLPQIVVGGDQSSGKSRPEDEQQRLRKFTRSIKDFAELPSIIDDAAEEMGLSENEHRTFCRDVLSIEICGPNRPQLSGYSTLVDLPGLIHSPNQSQSDEDVELTKSLVQSYISQKRTIIFAVISAKNCRKFDPQGARTLGVITKLDYLRLGSDNERVWLDLAQNRDIYFELGWHLLKNRGDGEHQISFTERNLNERLFFNNGNYHMLPKHTRGIDSLRANG